MTEILGQFRDEELPASTVDVSRAVWTGRRHRRIRRVLAISGAVVALAVAGGAVPFLVSNRPAPGPVAPTCNGPQPTQTPGPTRTSVSTFTSPSTWDHFNPLTREIDTSGVTGYRVTLSATSTFWQIVNLQRIGGGGNGPGAVTVILFSCQGEPHYFDSPDQAVPFDPAAGEPAGLIHGAQAYWLPADKMLAEGTQNQGLAWQWIPGAWAIVFAEPEPPASTVDPSALRSVVAQVAPQLRLGGGTPVASPFMLPVPDGMYPAATVTFRAGDLGQQFPVSFAIRFEPLGEAEPTHPYSAPDVASFVSVTANLFASINDRPSGATPYHEDLGYPAYQTVVDTGTQDVDALLVYEFSGFAVDIMPVNLPGASTQAERMRMAADIFRTITAYPDAATNESAWGNPIRS